MTQLQRNSNGGQHQYQWHPQQQRPTPQQPQPQQQQQEQEQPNLESHLQEHLKTTGEIARLQLQLHAQLVECGWRDAIAERAKEMIRQKDRGGLADVTLEELVRELMKMRAGRDVMVPEEIKGKMLNRLEGEASVVVAALRNKE